MKLKQLTRSEQQSFSIVMAIQYKMPTNIGILNFMIRIQTYAH